MIVYNERPRYDSLPVAGGSPIVAAGNEFDLIRAFL